MLKNKEVIIVIAQPRVINEAQKGEDIQLISGIPTRAVPTGIKRMMIQMQKTKTMKANE